MLNNAILQAWMRNVDAEWTLAVTRSKWLDD